MEKNPGTGMATANVSYLGEQNPTVHIIKDIKCGNEGKHSQARE